MVAGPWRMRNVGPVGVPVQGYNLLNSINKIIGQRFISVFIYNKKTHSLHFTDNAGVTKPLLTEIN